MRKKRKPAKKAQCINKGIRKLKYQGGQRGGQASAGWCWDLSWMGWMDGRQAGWLGPSCVVSAFLESLSPSACVCGCAARANRHTRRNPSPLAFRLSQPAQQQITWALVPRVWLVIDPPSASRLPARRRRRRRVATIRGKWSLPNCGVARKNCEFPDPTLAPRAHLHAHVL